MKLNSVLTICQGTKLLHLAQHICNIGFPKRESMRLGVPKIYAADDLNEAANIISAANPDIIILDEKFLQNFRKQLEHNTEGPQNAKKCVWGTPDNNTPQTPVIVIGSAPAVPQGQERGGFIYLHSTDDIGQLEQIINQIPALSCDSKSGDKNRPSGANEFFTEPLAQTIGIAGKSQSVLEQLKMIKLVAASACNPILIIGETGTGKELAAKAIHHIRSRNENFVALNCAALTASLLESELFGHVKGSFTGADRDKTGLLELAGQGTVFLDEISEMPIELQAKLLRVIQEKDFRKVGGTENIVCKATIIASSNRNLCNETRQKRFRSDLYYRLNICPIHIEPLRSPKRKEDISLLTQYFINTSSLLPPGQNKATAITTLALEALCEYNWPGNIRELRNVIDRALLFETSDKIGLASIIIEPAAHPESDENSPRSLLEQTSRGDKITNFSLEKAERQLIARALQETGWQKTQAAALLGISRATLYAKLEQYNIQPIPHLLDPQHQREKKEGTNLNAVSYVTS